MGMLQSSHCTEVLVQEWGLSKAWPLSPAQLADSDLTAMLSLVLSRWQDLRPLYAGRCQYYSKSTTPPEVRAGSSLLSL